MNQQSIAPHEILQLRELLTFKNLCLTKSVTMSPLVSDDELKSILQQDVTLTQQHVKELRGFVQQSSIVTFDSIES